jgi:tetratricopeptide (TPR) repeat protein
LALGVSKHKHTPHRASHSRKQDAFSPEPLSQRGRNAFYAGRFNDAIELWERAAKKHPEVIPALAEAYFRRAMMATTSPEFKRSPEHGAFPETSLRALQRATELQPNDAIYYYHLGLAHHRRGELDAALLAYEITAGLPTPPRGLVFSLALARLESDPNSDPGALDGLAENERALLDTLAHVLRGDTSFIPQAPTSSSWIQSLVAKFSGADPTTALVRGLVYLMASQDAAAQKVLDSAQGLASHAQALRHYYLGVLAARRGDWSNATMDWQQARARGMDTPWLRANIAAAHLPSAISAVQAENWNAAVEHARTALHAQPDSSAAAHVAVMALNHQAQNVAHRGQWTQAATLWREASEIH